MSLQELNNRVIDQLYAGLTGGSADLPLPQNTMIHWLQPGIPFHESAFDWAIAGPFAGPTPLTLDYFKELVTIIQGEGDQAMSREQAIEKAKLMYQQQLLGSWEQWSRLVDFIPLANPKPSDTRWKAQSEQGKYKHQSIVYAQAGQTLSRVYQDTLQRCEVADEELTEEQKKLVERMKALLQEEVEVTDFLTGEKKKEFRDSRALTAYKEKQIAYENAVIDYAARLARANNGTAADLIEWTRSGGIYKQRAINALRDWIGSGYKRDVERAQATINQILGTSMVAWIDKLRLDVEEIENNMQGSFGYPFFPAAILPGSFARSSGWSRLEEYKLHQTIKTSSSSRNWSGVGGLNLGFFSIYGSAGGSQREENFSFEREEFGISFDYTQVEIVRPAFNPNFFLSRGWRPKDSFIRDYGPLHSDGKENPSGAMIGYPTKALFVRNLKIYSQDFANYMQTKQDEISGGAVFSLGPFCVGGRYAQSNRESESNLDIQGSVITVKGLQLVAFLSALFPYTANPSPSVKKWI
ncbi:hypothetical protein [Leptolyngbya ohadii]|uniref:hypothetical protein n=1 Tax=Leptolyngbya ohadii TaxID=1962290 RepID=UPI0015C5891A|nr:hypothetical protein [Leptolyngbya ohadii]